MSVLRVSVFGSSTAERGGDAWTAAHELGKAMGARKWHVRNGGYGGTMGAMAEGMRGTGGTCEGVICPGIFTHRPAEGNSAQTSRVAADTIPQRLLHLVDTADAFIALPGSLGTLTELMLALNVVWLTPGRTTVPLVAWRTPWEGVFADLAARIGMHDDVVGRHVHFVDSVEEAVRVIEQHAAQNEPAE